MNIASKKNQHLYKYPNKYILKLPCLIFMNFGIWWHFKLWLCLISKCIYPVNYAFVFSHSVFNFRVLKKPFVSDLDIKNSCFVSRSSEELWWWRPAKLRLTSCCSVRGFLWTSAAASCSPRAALVKAPTTSSWLTPTVCGRSVQVHPTSRRGRRCDGLVGIRSNALFLLSTCCFSQELNRRLRAPVEAFFTHLCQVVRPCLSGSDSRPDGGPQISLIRGDDGDLRVKLKSELAGLPFYWEFHCCPAPLTVVRSIFHRHFWPKCVCKNFEHFYSTVKVTLESFLILLKRKQIFQF